MKKTVLTYGLISGAILSLMMLCTLPFLDKIGFEKGEVIGYTTMVLSFLLVFFGIRSYRENVGGGIITFGRAFKVGILITLISCVCYVVTWEIIYFKLAPDFGEKYANYAIEQLRASGAAQQVIEAKLQQMKSFKALYDNPLINAAISFIEPFPIGLIMTVISAAILRRKPRPESREEEVGAAALSS
ncbi:MAG: DUF4199 domain-containing protein [Acidobacteria bacterium]|nr:DUF4199 domain-containing protein [Acidobacteriota bacterium]